MFPILDGIRHDPFRNLLRSQTRGMRPERLSHPATRPASSQDNWCTRHMTLNHSQNPPTHEDTSKGVKHASGSDPVLYRIWQYVRRYQMDECKQMGPGSTISAKKLLGVSTEHSKAIAREVDLFMAPMTTNVKAMSPKDSREWCKSITKNHTQPKSYRQLFASKDKQFVA